MDEYVHKLELLGLGLAAMTKEKAEELVEELVKKGELSEKEGNSIVSELMKKSEKQKGDLERMLDKEIKKAAERLNLATKDDIKRLEKKIEAMKRR